VRAGRDPPLITTRRPRIFLIYELRTRLAEAVKALKIGTRLRKLGRFSIALDQWIFSTLQPGFHLACVKLRPRRAALTRRVPSTFTCAIF